MAIRIVAKQPGTATEPTATPDSAVYPIFPATGDIQQAHRWDQEAFQLYTNQYKYYVLDIQSSKPDKLYGEASDIDTGGDVYANEDDPIFVHSYLYWGDTIKKLSKFGITTDREVVAEFSIPMLRAITHDAADPDEGLQPKAGDVIVVNGTEYVIREAKEGQPWWGNIQYPIHVYCSLEIKKQSSIDDERADTSTSVSEETPVADTPPPAERPDSLYG